MINPKDPDFFLEEDDLHEEDEELLKKRRKEYDEEAQLNELVERLILYAGRDDTY